jgi:hypothetical protein
MTRSLRSFLSLLLLAALLCTPAMASGGRGAQPKGPTGLFSALWGFLESLAPMSNGAHPSSEPLKPGLSSKAGTGCDLGSVMDPNGCPSHSQTTGGSPDLGSVMDPDG